VARRLVPSALALLILAGCGWPPVRDGQTTVLPWALERVERMRAAYNRGECAGIYEEASQPFRLLESREDWLAECELIRASLGEWRSFDAKRAETGHAIEVHVSGRAVFARGEGQLQTTWVIEAGGARLFSLWLDTGDWRTAVPAPRFRPRHSWIRRADGSYTPPSGKGQNGTKEKPWRYWWCISR
jgi:hypothetical protein